MAANPKYVAQIRAGLDDAFERAASAGRQAYDPAEDRIVVLSDQHKGIGNKADDFRRAEHAYSAALGYYLEQGFRLFVLGDSEELWEESPPGVFERYEAVFELERRFADSGRGGVDRFWGNHDDRWSHRSLAEKELSDWVGSGVPLREGLVMDVRSDTHPGVALFFVHGHQGTAASDKLGFISRLFVRWVWRPIQRRTGFSATTPARDASMRGEHNEAMFAWASGREQPVILISGHTHKPVFAGAEPPPPPTRPIEQLEAALANAVAEGDRDAAAGLAAELEYARTALRRPDHAVTPVPPCYFNTGCCAYPDGDVTGLELADGEIRLVRWPANLRDIGLGEEGGVRFDDRILQRERLDDVLAAVTDPDIEPALEVEEVRPPLS